MVDAELASPYYPGLGGLPLQFGSIYYGVAGQNPVTNPVQVYWDAAGTQQAAQPISVSNGRPSRNGAPATVYISGDYSKLVLDSMGRTVSYEPSQASRNLAALSFVQDGVGAVSRSAQDKMREWVSVADYGADLTGAVSSTAELQKAINFCKTSAAHNAIYVLGILAFDPSALDFTGLTRQITLIVCGELRPSSTMVMTGKYNIYGIGGTQPGEVQFQMKTACRIVAPPGNVPVIRVATAAGTSIENVSMPSVYQGIVCDGANQLGALLKLENVNILCTQAGGTALVADAFFWLFARDCRFLTNDSASKSLFITNSSVAFSSVGLLFFDKCTTAARGVSVNPSVGDAGNIYFTHHHHESLSVGEDFFYAKPGSHNICFNVLGVSDSAPGAGFTFDVAGVFGFSIDKAYGYTFRTVPKGLRLDRNDYALLSQTPIDVAADAVDKDVSAFGDRDARLLSRSSAGDPQLSLGVGATLVPATSGSFVVTANQPAPDGSSTAFLCSVPAGTGLIYNNQILASSLDLDGGDFMVFGAWMKAQVDGNDIGNGNNSMTAAVTVPNGINNPGTISLAGSATKWARAGWVPVYGIMPITGTKTANSGVVITLSAYSDRGFYIWKPWYRVIDATLGLNKSAVLRWLNAIAAPADMASGMIGLHAHQTFRTGLNTTANRPTTGIGQGSMFYDTTLNKPIWRDGAGNWRDAAGTIV